MLEIRAGMNVQASILCQKALPACGCIRKPRSLEDATTVAVTTTVAQPVEPSGGRNVQTKTLSMERRMTVGEHLAEAAGWEARQRQMAPLAVVAVICLIFGATVSWPWFLGTVLAFPYFYAWIGRARALAAVNDIFSR